MSTPPFVELLARSAYSFLEGVSQPGALMEAAHARGMEAIALCDRNGLYGLPRAHEAVKRMAAEQPARALRLIVGAEIDLEDHRGTPTGSIALLAEDQRGYTSLCRLLTAAHAQHPKGEAGLTLEQLARDGAAGLLAVLPLEADVLVSTEPILEVLHEVFAGRSFVAVWRHAEPADALRVRAAREIEARFAVPVIASARPTHHERAQRPLVDVVTCIRDKTTLAAAGTRLAVNAERILRGSAEMASRFADAPQWVSRTAEIASRCRFGLGDVAYGFPSETSCQPGESPDAALRRVVELGAQRRYPGGVPARVREQLERELVLIARLGVAPYFLSVRDIVEMARRRGILCQGRGSAANSAVCYVIGVTAVDPARHELLFERFLSAERAEPPDIDVDFEHERREEVIQEIYQTWGRERAAMASTMICYRGRSALREVGKVFGLEEPELDRLSKLVMHHDFEWDVVFGGARPRPARASEHEARLRELGLRPEEPRLRQVLALAGLLQGLPRHLSIHVGGFVVSSEPLDSVSAVEPARMKGRTVIPWDKDDLDTLGFFKMDVLGLGMLTAIRKALAIVHARGELSGSRDPETGALTAFDPIEALARIPPEDPRVYDALCEADTVGVFQIESRAQRSMLPRLAPRSFYDLVIEVAIVRPGPIQGGMVHPYLRRRMGQEPIESPHPSLDPILARTLGVPLFQEQVMQIAMVGAGYTPGEADQLRRDMAAWKRNGNLARHRDKLLRGFAARGIAERFAEQLYKQVHGFAEYGFPESHAASFALLVYASAWLKVHHHAAFTCALLNSQPMGFYSASSLVQDAQAHGVEVLAPDVCESEWDSHVFATPPKMRLGLRQIVGFREHSARAIVAARQQRLFADVHDVAQRAQLDRGELELLAEAGALSSLVSDRRQALWQARAPRERGLWDAIALESTEPVSLPPITQYEQLLLDYARTRLSVHDHPLAHLRAMLRARGPGLSRVCTAAELQRLPHGARVAVGGLVIGRQRPATASGVTFVTLEDETGTANLVVWRDVFDAHWRIATHAPALIAEGEVQRDEVVRNAVVSREGVVVHVLVRRFEPLEVPRLEGVRSRDFH